MTPYKSNHLFQEFQIIVIFSQFQSLPDYAGHCGGFFHCSMLDSVHRLPATTLCLHSEAVAGILLPRRICASCFWRCGSTVNLLFLVTSMVRPRDLETTFGISHSIS